MSQLVSSSLLTVTSFFHLSECAQEKKKSLWQKLYLKNCSCEIYLIFTFSYFHDRRCLSVSRACACTLLCAYVRMCGCVCVVRVSACEGCVCTCACAYACECIYVHARMCVSECECDCACVLVYLWVCMRVSVLVRVFACTWLRVFRTYATSQSSSGEERKVLTR